MARLVLGRVWRGLAWYGKGANGALLKGKGMYEKKYRFAIEGISPLIMHWDNIEWADQMSKERDRIKKDDGANFAAGDDRCPPQTWKGYTYHDGEVLVIPCDNLRATLMKAAVQVIFKKQKTFKELSQSGILFDDAFYPLTFGGKTIAISAIKKIEGTFAEHAKAVKELGFELFVKRAGVNNKKHVRVRPLFRQWSLGGTFTVVDAQITLEALTNIWGIAGPRVGLCDWRPGSPKSPGPYGRYATELTVM